MRFIIEDFSLNVSPDIVKFLLFVDNFRSFLGNYFSKRENEFGSSLLTPERDDYGYVNMYVCVYVK